jgi:SsrA-binding protein
MVYYQIQPVREGEVSRLPQKKASGSLAENRKARHDYFIEETYEAGIVLVGTEVKSIRMGRVNLRDAYCMQSGQELFLVGAHVSPYEKGNIFNRDPMRTRKLLLHKREIAKLAGLTQQEGYALIPLGMYLKNGRVKVSIGVAKGKKLYDKRQDMAERDAKRDIERAFRQRQKG